MKSQISQIETTTADTSTLDKLWQYVNHLHLKQFPDHGLMPILGGGRSKNPRGMLVFINPTSRNISSSPDWGGPRYPFIGTKDIWRVFHRAGLLNQELTTYIEHHKLWSTEFTHTMLSFLDKQGYYLTNLVKWTGQNAALPDTAMIKLFLPILIKEIELVRPQYIMTFGSIPFKALTGRAILLDNYYKNVLLDAKLRFFEGPVSSKIIPNYFPVGRGNPKRAIELLKLFHSSKVRVNWGQV